MENSTHRGDDHHHHRHHHRHHLNESRRNPKRHSSSRTKSHARDTKDQSSDNNNGSSDSKKPVTSKSQRESTKSKTSKKSPAIDLQPLSKSQDRRAEINDIGSPRRKLQRLASPDKRSCYVPVSTPMETPDSGTSNLISTNEGTPVGSFNSQKRVYIYVRRFDRITEVVTDYNSENRRLLDVVINQWISKLPQQISVIFTTNVSLTVKGLQCWTLDMFVVPEDLPHILHYQGVNEVDIRQIQKISKIQHIGNVIHCCRYARSMAGPYGNSSSLDGPVDPQKAIPTNSTTPVNPVNQKSTTQKPEDVQPKDSCFVAHYKKAWIKLTGSHLDTEKEVIKPQNDLDLIGMESIIEEIRTAIINPIELNHPEVGIKKGFVLCGSPGSGKCLDPNELVLMFDGHFKPIRDILPGDQLMGDDSTPRTVLSITSGIDEMFKIIPCGPRGSAAEPYIVNRPHVLSLRYRSESTIPSKSIDIPLEEFQQKSEAERSLYSGYQVGVDFPEQHEVQSEDFGNPYVLGYWLGKYSAISSDVMKNFGGPIDQKRGQEGYPSAILRSGSAVISMHSYDLGQLEKYDLINTRHLPHIYKVSSRKIRLEILAGLIDATGQFIVSGSQQETIQYEHTVSRSSEGSSFSNYIEEQSHYCLHLGQPPAEISTDGVSSPGPSKSSTRTRLLDDVIYLIRSLGFVCSSKRVVYSDDTSGPKEVLSALSQTAGTYDRVLIGAANGRSLEEIPIFLQTRRNSELQKSSDSLATHNVKRTSTNRRVLTLQQIRDRYQTRIEEQLSPAVDESSAQLNESGYDFRVEPLGRGPYCGFELSGNGRFLLKDFTVTHNTSMGRWLAYQLKGKLYTVGAAAGVCGDTFIQTVQTALKDAAKNAPAVVFIDDVDTIFEHDDSYRGLLTLLDGIDNKKRGNVCVIVTCMDIRKIPASLIRGGRLEMCLMTKLPSHDNIVTMLRNGLEKIVRVVASLEDPTARSSTDRKESSDSPQDSSFFGQQGPSILSQMAGTSSSDQSNAAGTTPMVTSNAPSQIKMKFTSYDIRRALTDEFVKSIAIRMNGWNYADIKRCTDDVIRLILANRGSVVGFRSPQENLMELFMGCITSIREQYDNCRKSDCETREQTYYT